MSKRAEMIAKIKSEKKENWIVLVTKESTTLWSEIAGDVETRDEKIEFCKKFAEKNGGEITLITKAGFEVVNEEIIPV